MILKIVTGEVKDPDSEGKEKSADAKVKQWRRDNNFAILTMKWNCESEAVDVIGLARTANKAYLELQAKYEGKTLSTLGALLINIIKTSYDDRIQTIEEHISDFDKKWSFMWSTLGGGIPDDLKEFWKILVDLSKNDQVKGTFLLATLPAYYNSLVENI